MAQEKKRTTRDEVLREIDEVHKNRRSKAEALLANIKTQRAEIETLLTDYKREEPDLIYRFYHQSYKFFIMTDLVQRAVDLFKRLAPEPTELNEWYGSMATEAVNKKFDWEKTNSIWLAETLPVLQGYWHSKYFLEQMRVAADELDAAPEILPSGWAAVLYLYNLR
jgi:hypothetical protein